MKKYVRAARVGREKEIYVVQEYTGYGYGWEDVCTYSDTSSQSLREARQDVKDYRDNGYQARVITRRIPNPDYVEPTNELDAKMVMDYITSELVGVSKKSDPNANYISNYLIGKYPNCCQIFDRDDGIYVYNAGTNRTKKVYTMQQLKDTINKIINK